MGVVVLARGRHGVRKCLLADVGARTAPQAGCMKPHCCDILEPLTEAADWVLLWSESAALTMTGVKLWGEPPWMMTVVDEGRRDFAVV